MLSKLALVILGFIAEKPLNPYEIKKVFKRLNIDKWFPIGSSSIYATIKSLVKKNYISGERTRTGKMPEKTIYSITLQGEEALQNALKAYLGEREQVTSEFDLALLLICHLNKEAAIEALVQHRSWVEREIAGRREAYTRLENTGNVPYNGFIIMKHAMYKREAELKTINELIEHIEADTEWDHFPVLDLLHG